MIEKCNPSHPDKICDRIGGAIVDLAYVKRNDAIVAGEILLGHGKCHIIIETNVEFTKEEIKPIVDRIVGEKVKLDLVVVPQDEHLAKNQEGSIKCGDNGIFKGVPLTDEEREISRIAKDLYSHFPTDGKYILHNKNLIICQSCATTEDIEKHYKGTNVIINPLGEWVGGPNTDCGCANRKLGSDMAQSMTGGGLHFKDLSKADVSVNIYCFEKAQELKQVVRAYCAIGSEYVTVYFGENAKKVPYKEIVDFANHYIERVGGFEKFGEWGLF